MIPRISVVMPVYNGEAYLGPALASILAQEFRDFELIVVDDGSTDRTASILAACSDPRLRVVTQASNGGITRALNAALPLAQGEYLCRMDADDIARPDRLGRQAAFLDAHPDVALVGSQAALIGPAGEALGEERYPQEPGEIRRTIFVHNPFAHGSVMLRKRVLDECGGYDPRFLHNEDYDLWLRICARYDTANLPETLIERRIHPSSITSSREAELVLFRLKTLAHAIEEYYGKPYYCLFLIRPFFAWLWKSALAGGKR